MTEKKICNKCGRELDFFDLQQGVSIRKKIGYGSRYDGFTVEYNLCCDCFDKEIELCRVSPIIDEEA